MYRIEAIDQPTMQQLVTPQILLEWLNSHEDSIQVCVGAGRWDTKRTEIEEDDIQSGTKARNAMLATMQEKSSCWATVQPSEKFKTTLQILHNCHEAGVKTIIYCNFLHPLHLLQGLLYKTYQHTREVYWLSGKQKQQREKEDHLWKFRRSSCPSAILLAVPRTGGIGINVVEAQVVIFLCQSMNPQVDVQCLSRCWRRGMFFI